MGIPFSHDELAPRHRGQQRHRGSSLKQEYMHPTPLEAPGKASAGAKVKFSAVEGELKTLEVSNSVQSAAEQTRPKPKPKLRRGQSGYDLGQKGYLTPVEEICRKYDTNGTVSI